MSCVRKEVEFIIMSDCDNNRLLLLLQCQMDTPRTKKAGFMGRTTFLSIHIDAAT